MDDMENTRLTPEESLKIIQETLENNRRSMYAKGVLAYLLWGSLLMIFSLGIYLLWSRTGNGNWNLIWIALPVIGYSLSMRISLRGERGPRNLISKMLRDIWNLFCLFGVSLFILSWLIPEMDISLILILLFGFALSLSGVGFKNAIITICGFVIAIGGAILSFVLDKDPEQLLMFTFAGLMLIITGLLVRHSIRHLR